eukprot:s130_g13.t1
MTSTTLSCGKRGTYGTGLALVAVLVAAGCLWRRASFAWQAWHLVTSAFVVCVCVAGVALGDIHVPFVWQVWHLRHLAGSGGGLGVALTALTGLALVAALAPHLFCVAGVAGVALGDICLRFVWHVALACGAAPLLRGRRVTLMAPSRRRASVALGDLRGRCRTYGTGLFLVAALVGAGLLWHHASFACVCAGVVLMALGWLWWRHWSVAVPLLRGKRGTGDIHVPFVWQAWHLLGWFWWRPGRPFCMARGAW